MGGDAGIGHFVYPRPVPVPRPSRTAAYPGCYALSKVLEEVMLEQYYMQYGLNGCCLRAPWIMEKDDFKYQLSFGEDVFGGPRWRDLVGRRARRRIPARPRGAGDARRPGRAYAAQLCASQRPDVDAILLAIGHPKARQQTFNICMDEPVDYGEVGVYLAATRGLHGRRDPHGYHSTWLDNAKAKFLLG